MTAQTYSISGTYYEACNCEAICPCRRQNGAPGGRSSFGRCDFILSWSISAGRLGEVDLAGRSVCMAGTYLDDEEGSPWSVHIYIDDGASDAQFAALGLIFRGKAQGNIAFTAYISNVLSLKRAKIDLDHTAGTETIRIGGIAEVSVEHRVDFDGTVSCGIPGHDHPGHESVSSIELQDGPFQWDYKARCGFSTDFAYWN